MRASFAIAASFLTAQLIAQPRMPASTLLALKGIHTLADQQTDPRKLADTARDRYSVAYMNGRCMVGFLGKASGDAQLMSDAQIVWGARAGAVVSFHVDAHHLDRLNALTGVTYAQLAGTRRRMLDKVVHDMHADSAQQGSNLPQTYTGRNVIIGIVDAGFDYAHPMFYDTAMIATRILAAWDPNKLSGPPPMGYTYGTVYEGAVELLAAQGDTIDALGIRDFHGTHVAGIAGGGGAGTAYRGVA
ncbi:MAG: S8 family serine peptidase, partial [Flavobacteriales bacterium]